MAACKSVKADGFYLSGQAFFSSSDATKKIGRMNFGLQETAVVTAQLENN